MTGYPYIQANYKLDAFDPIVAVTHDITCRAVTVSYQYIITHYSGLKWHGLREVKLCKHY